MSTKSTIAKLLPILLVTVILLSVIAITAFASTDTDETPKFTGLNEATYPASDFPFVMYRADGKFASAKSSLNGILESAKSTLKNSNYNAETGTFGAGSVCYVVMRRNYDVGENDKFYNATQLAGKVIIDLNGYTLGEADPTHNTGAIFKTPIKSYSSAVGNKDAFPTDIIMKNGTIELKSNALVSASVNGNAAGTKRNAFIFRDVTIRAKEGFGVKNPLISYTSTSGITEYAAQIELEFTDCSFDFSNATGALTLFDANTKPANDPLFVSHVYVNGGNIILPSVEKLTFDAVDTYGSSVVYGKSAKTGNYTTIAIPSSSSSPAIVGKSAEGKSLSFAKTEDDGVIASYKMANTADLFSYVPKTNVTLDSCFIFNIYLPKSEMLTKAVLDGLEYDLNEVEIANINGEDHWCIRMPLNAGEAAKTLELLLTIEYNGQPITGRFSFSIPKYLAKLLSGATNNRYERLLASDILAYVKSAYTYFGNPNDTSLEYLEELIQRYPQENSFKKRNKTYDIGTGIVGAAYDLSYIPELRLYLPEGRSASDYTFTVNGYELEYETGYENTNPAYMGLEYVCIYLYAYRMSEVINYTTTSGESGSYHINSYYDFVSNEYTGEDKAALVDLVQKLYIFTNSARLYRNSVYVPNCKDHKDSDNDNCCDICDALISDANVFNKMQSVLLIGQSNMSGRGDLSEVAKIYDERIFMLRDAGWVTMQEPIHTAGRAGAGIGASFAKAFVETFNCNLGLIPAAVGGTSLEEWSVDGYTDADGKLWTLYADAIAAAKRAQETSEICAILWHQGESNQNDPQYAEKLQVIFDAMIEELGLDKDKIVIITGELFGTRSDAVHKGELEELGKHYTNYGIAESDGLTVFDVTTHFDAPSLRVFGYRYFDIFYNCITGKHYDFVDDPDHYRVSGSDDGEADYILNQNFNSTATGTLKTESNVVTSAPKDGSITVVEEVGFSDQKYLNFTNGYSESSKKYTDTYADFYASVKGGSTVAVELKIKLGSKLNTLVDVGKIVTTVNGSTVTANGIRIGTDGYIYNMRTGDTSFTTAANNQDHTHEAFSGYQIDTDGYEWTTIKIVFDFAKNAKVVYADGEVIIESVIWTSDLDYSNQAFNRIRTIQMVTRAGDGTTTMLMDDLAVYNTTLDPIPTVSEEFSSFTEGELTAKVTKGTTSLVPNASSGGNATVIKDGDNKYVAFGGKSAYVDITGAAAAGAKVIYEVRFRLTGDVNVSADFVKTVDSANKSTKHLSINGGKLKDGTTSTSLLTLELDKWYTLRVELDYSNNTKKVFIDGTQYGESLTIVEGDSTAASALTIAKNRCVQVTSNNKSSGKIEIDDYKMYVE